MQLVRFHFHPALATLGGILLTVGAGLVAFFPASTPVAGIIFVVGLVLTAAAFFEFQLTAQKLYEVWDSNQVRRWLKKAPPHSRVRIAQTWFPDVENFLPFLQDLLSNKGKRFSLQVMLIPHEPAHDDDLLAARIRLRPESRGSAVRRVRDTVYHLIALKEAVDSAWSKDGAHFDLEIRQYHFLPFGPIYQISDKVLFVGFYISDRSSEAAPMIRLTNPRSGPWKTFNDHFDKGWEDATCLYPRPTND